MILDHIHEMARTSSASHCGLLHDASSVNTRSDSKSSEPEQDDSLGEEAGTSPKLLTTMPDTEYTTSHTLWDSTPKPVE